MKGREKTGNKSVALGGENFCISIRSRIKLFCKRALDGVLVSADTISLNLDEFLLKVVGDDSPFAAQMKLNRN